MIIKKLAKVVISTIKIRILSISSLGNCYIGKNVKIHNSKHLFLESNITIRPNVELFIGEKLEVGQGTEIGTRSRISVKNSAKIGNNVLISPNVYITDCDHRYDLVDEPIISQGIVNKNNRILIGDDSYIGINSVIIGNVSLGKHVIIGANSVVTKNVPAYSVAAGNPAKIIKQYEYATNTWNNIDILV